jgi:histidyl-tRNA synthetase
MNAPKLSTKPPSGMRDFLPEDLARRQFVIDIVRDIYSRHGFVPLETPTIENLSTLLGKYGEEGDQLLYRILHRRDNLSRALAAEPSQATLSDEGLRYDLTVPLARVVAQYELPKFFKRYQIQPVWRADRPGKGRFREFYQCDVDITGTQSLIAEAEVCGAVAEVLHALGFKDFKIRLNHRQLLRSMMLTAGIDLAHEAAALVAVDKLDKIGDGGVREELAARGIPGESANILMELILMAEADALFGIPFTRGPSGPKAGLTIIAKRITDPAGVAAIAELDQLVDLLAATPAGPHVSLSLDLARGLGYYTGAIFEIAVPDLNGSLGGGGRYDNLVGMFGKKQVPAVGFSLGLERILVVMEERKMFPTLSVGPQLLLCWMGVAPAAVLGVAGKLRSQGLKVEVFPEEGKLGKQLQYADSPGVKAPLAGILGEEELAAGELTLKHLGSGEQTRVRIDEAGAAVQRLLAP